MSSGNILPKGSFLPDCEVYNAFNAGELALGKAVHQFIWGSWNLGALLEPPMVGEVDLLLVLVSDESVEQTASQTSTARRGGSRTGEPLPRMAHATCHRRHAVEKPLNMEQLDILGPNKNEIQKNIEKL